MLALLRRFRSNDRGLAGVEFGIVLPFLVILFLGTVEIGRFVYLNMKLQNAAGNVADIVSRPETVAASDLSSLFTAAPVMLRPFEAGANLRIFVSGVIVPDQDDPPEVNWQADGGGSLSTTSAVGQVGEVAAIPGGLAYHGGEAVIVAEVVYDYEPWLLQFAGGGEIRKSAYFRPRRGTLASIN